MKMFPYTLWKNMWTSVNKVLKKSPQKKAREQSSIYAQGSHLKYYPY